MTQISAFDWVGLDFGSQKGNTTAFAYFDGSVRYVQSNKQEDTDMWINQWLSDQSQMKHIFIDAPLSLPEAYFNRGDDFMFREADRELGAMSPMFLGGLTARAIRLKNILNRKGIQMTETYPAHLEKILFGSKSPKKNSFDIERVSHLQDVIEVKIQQPANRHQYDACLAWVSAWRYFKGESVEFGKPSEGLIHV